ncbi:MAG: acetyl-CoA carboxylase biotin carboxyl carrier protein subunit [Deltaproteobacteria bacterium]|nr:acetyl-CoA carboxylase biotin carboxyl carrier protein subunit [Deltaproteobacteria bacterium]MBF0508723.1 acetyl-CoA carboxylase biotin carboxyl carrier protein subunit [Deltaproteobacteria bacterium]MBF0527175.1 acetyl-CoA carboxylase biotin carboxyl carrier protein subunit [Deltaproteobacteria bacterium]MBF0527331.1 acetyl-CoA carboxylase biotin carboxyl carrier protein subunit [Deltaproteobacteria bacterium]
MSEVLAPMSGKVIDLKVKVGDSVKEDDEVIIIEAMKMEMPLAAPSDGTVKAVNVKVGDSIDPDAVLMVIE